MPVVSILLPVYNGATYVAEAIESVRKQTFLDWELLITDDGSRDATPRICADFAAENPRIQFRINEGNLHIPGNINALASRARGEFICILSQDDRLEPEYLATLVDSAHRTGADLTMSNFVEIDSLGTLRDTTHHAPWKPFIFRGLETVFEPCQLVPEIYRCCSFPFSITSLIRTERFRKVNGYHRDYPYVCDGNFHLDLMLDGGNVCFVDRAMFQYRRHEDMATLREGRSRMAEELHYVLARHLPRATRLFEEYPYRTSNRILRRAWKRLLTATFTRSYPTKFYWSDMAKASIAMVAGSSFGPYGGTLVHHKE